MRLPDDDELYEVDQTYLGPPRRYIGEMRYRTIFLFLVIAPVTLVLLRKLGMPVTLLSMGLWLIGASYLSMKASDYISSESSAGAWLMTFWHELTTPRVETGVQYAGGAAAVFRHATSPRGGWAKAMRRPGRRFAQQPGAAPAPSPRLLQATVVASTPPVRGKAAPVRPVIEAKVVEEPLPADLTVQPEARPAMQQQASGVRPAKGGWSSRPSSSPREPRDVPWKGGAPWQARQETTGARPSEGVSARSVQQDQPAPAPETAATAPPPPPPAPPVARPAPPMKPPTTPPPPPPPPPSAAPAAPKPAPKPAPEPTPEPAPKPARQPLAHAIRPAVVIAPEPGLDGLDEADFDDFDDAPSGRTRPRDNQDEWAATDERPQSVDDYRKRLNGDDAPNDGGTA